MHTTRMLQDNRKEIGEGVQYIRIFSMTGVNPYRNENVAALELQYCSSRAAIKF